MRDSQENTATDCYRKEWDSLTAFSGLKTFATDLRVTGSHSLVSEHRTGVDQEAKAPAGL